VSIFDKRSPEEKAAHAVRVQETKTLAETRLATEEARKAQATLEKFDLDIDAYDSATLRAKNVKTLRAIARDLAGNKWFKFGLALTFGKPEEQAKVTYLSALVEQNWIIIRQNERMLRLLEGRRFIENPRQQEEDSP
jgi:hypothetical protein